MLVARAVFSALRAALAISFPPSDAVSYNARPHERRYGVAQSAFVGLIVKQGYDNRGCRTLLSQSFSPRMTPQSELDDRGDQISPAAHIAVLLRDSDSVDGGITEEGISHILSTQGFDVRVAPPSGDTSNTYTSDAAGLSIFLNDPNLTVSRSCVYVFDLAGHGGRELTVACQEEGAGGLYAFKLATGMFRKVFGKDELPSWIDPRVGSSYEQILNDRGWGFLAEDKSEPRLAFDPTETIPWERARGEGPRQARDKQNVSPLGYCMKRMTDSEVETAAAGLTPKQRYVLLEGGTDAPNVADTTPSARQESSDTSSSAIQSDNAASSENAIGSTCSGFGKSGESDLIGRGAGTFVCALGGLPVFCSEDALAPVAGVERSGWPGFRRPIHPDHVILREESGPLRRTEVLCARSGAHLGHVFNNGPPPEGQRFCINRSSLVFIPVEAELPPQSRPVQRPTVPLDGLGAFGEALRREEQLREETKGGTG